MKKFIFLPFFFLSTVKNLSAQNIVNEERVKVLKEVTVRAEKIRSAGDTIAFLTSSFAKESDRTIGGGLSEQPKGALWQGQFFPKTLSASRLEANIIGMICPNATIGSRFVLISRI